MPFVPLDYFGSPRVQQLLQNGQYLTALAYLHFLFTQWTKQGPIPTEHVGGAFRIPVGNTAAVLKALTTGGNDALLQHRGGLVWNERVRKDLLEADRFQSKKATAGAKGAQARWVPDATEETRLVAQRYLNAFNAAHKHRHTLTPTVIKCVDACLSASPPYSPDAIIAAAIMSTGDEWYSDREPAYPLRFRRAGATEGKNHLDDLLAKISPGTTYAQEIVDLAKAHGVNDYFRERTRR